MIGNAAVPDLLVNVRRVGAPGWSEIRISPNLTDRWGDLNFYAEDKKPLTPLVESPELLERLQSQMWDEITFIARMDGQYGILFEVEFCSKESEEGIADNSGDEDSLKSHKEVVAAIMRGIAVLEHCFPGVMFCVPDESQIVHDRPAVWAFVPDGKLSDEDRAALGRSLLAL
ncbi:MAG: hypothetical protein ABTQ25_06085 [Nitrosomonas ureae]